MKNSKEVGNMLKLTNSLIKFKSHKPEDIAKYALKNTDFYKKFYSNCDINNFESLPIMTKYDLVGVSPYDLLSQKYADKVFLYSETSGSSGSPTPSFLTKKDFEYLLSLSSLTPYIQDIKNALKENRMAVNGLTFGYTIAGFTFGSLMQKHGAVVAQIGTRSTIALPKRNAETIVKLKPSIICCTPLDFMTWMELIRLEYPKEYEDVKKNLKFLLSTAEPCAASRRRQIEQHFDITHINTYATVDGLVSIPCPCGQMHLVDGLNHVGLYDSNMNYIGVNGKGRLCFTNLVRKTAPLVKYMLDDLVTITDSCCKYGFKKSIIPHGRYELSLDINGRAWGNVDFEEIIYRHGLFMNYKVKVTDKCISILLEEYPPANNKVDLELLEMEIEELTNIKCNVSLFPSGFLTDCKKVREAKSVVKVLDMRKSSRQLIPSTL